MQDLLVDHANSKREQLVACSGSSQIASSRRLVPSIELELDVGPGEGAEKGAGGTKKGLRILRWSWDFIACPCQV